MKQNVQQTNTQIMNQHAFSFQQVQTACRLLIEEESHLIVDNVLPRRAGLVSDIFSRMIFDNFQHIDRNLISHEQATLIEHYGFLNQNSKREPSEFLTTM